MSRILRRPMFRGGRVDSRGTGITSGLSYNNGGRVGFSNGGSYWDRIKAANSLFFNDPDRFAPEFDRTQPRTFLGMNIPGTGMAVDESGEPIEIPQRNFADDALFFLGPSKFLKAGGGGLNLFKEMGKRNIAQGKDLVPFKEAPFLSNQYFRNLIQPYTSGMKETLKGTGQSIKDFGIIGTGGTVGGTWGLAKLYDAWKNNKDQVKKEETGDPEIDPEIAALQKTIEERDAFIKFLEEQAKVKKDKKLSKEEKVAKIKENEEMFREIYGSGRGEDVTNMLLSFAGKALKPGADTKSAFGEFFEEESKRPSERKKYKDAAAQAAIQSYLAGEKTLAEIEAFKAKTGWQLDEQAKYKKLANDPSSLDWTDRRTYYMTQIKGNNRDSNKVIKMSLQDEKSEQGKQIFETKDTEWITNPTEAAEMDDGLYIVTPKKGPKRIFEIKEGIVIDRSSDFPL